MSILTVIALVAGVLVLAVGVGIPQTWWPHTGHAFATDTRPTNQDPCELIVGPAQDYCERGTTTTHTHQARDDRAVWRLVPAAASVGALAVWCRRRPTRRGRR
ncbi:hypothetical protein [Streptomyces sp. NPDC057301]|uniref:hypothetical protein n=1 Tax=Streptomyces sp. NPDC057301 TaxID=3346093 RepID=UPI003632B699